MSEKTNRSKPLYETALDFAVGGVALAVDRARDLFGGITREARGAASEGLERARSGARDVRRSARSAAREMEERAEHVTGPDTRPYEERTLEELYDLAAERDIAGRSSMSKPELIAALRAER